MSTLRMKAALFTSAAVMLAAIVACNAPTGSAATEETLEPRTVITEAPTTIAATTAPTVVPTAAPSASFNGISFTADASLGTASGQMIPGETVDPNGPIWAMPEHTRFDFAG